MPNERKQTGSAYRSWNQQAGGSLVQLRLLFPGHIHLPSSALCHFLRSFAQRQTASLGGGWAQHAAGKAPRSQILGARGRRSDGGPAALPPRLSSDWRLVSCASVLLLSAPASKRRTLTRSPLRVLQTSPVRTKFHRNAWNMSSHVNIYSVALKQSKFIRICRFSAPHFYFIFIVFLKITYYFAKWVLYWGLWSNTWATWEIFYSTWRFSRLMIKKANSIPELTSLSFFFCNFAILNRIWIYYSFSLLWTRRIPELTFYVFIYLFIFVILTGIWMYYSFSLLWTIRNDDLPAPEGS